MSDKETRRREAMAKTGRVLREQVIKSGGRDPGREVCENRVKTAITNQERKK